MRFALSACLIVTMTNLGASAQTAAPGQAQSPAPLRARLTDEVITDAVKQTLASEQHETLIAAGQPLSAERYQKFGRQMSEARIPDCLHGDALKFQPTLFGGLLAIPFWAIAALRGKCR
jgi:hypothetical protein